MKSWANFHRLVLTSVIGCPLPVVHEKLVEAAREFCLRTHAWQETDEFTADGATQLFDFTAPTRTEVLKVVRAEVAGKPLDIFGRNLLPADWREGGVCGRALYQYSSDDYLLFPKPSAGQAIEVTVSVRPTLDGTGVGDELFIAHAEHIAAGARYRLLKMPRADWQDLAEAEVAKAEFESGVHEAANRDFMRTAPRSRRVKSWG